MEEKLTQIKQDTMMFFDGHQEVFPIYESFENMLLHLYPQTKMKQIQLLPWHTKSILTIPFSSFMIIFLKPSSLYGQFRKQLIPVLSIRSRFLYILDPSLVRKFSYQ